MKYPWLYVGAKVVCVDAKGRSGLYWNAPTEGGEYEIAGFTESRRDKGALCVLLSGHPNRHWVTGEDWGYRADRFRPLIDTTTQVNAMRKLMKRAAKTSKVDA